MKEKMNTQVYGTRKGIFSGSIQGWFQNFIFDHTLIIDRKVDDILKTGADIIGFSVHFSSEHMAKEIARRIKEKDRTKIVVFGGPQASRVNSGLELAALDYVDFVVQGEGEMTLEEIIKNLEENNKGKGLLEGTIFIRDGEIVDCGDRPLIPDLDSLPFADFSDFNFSRYLEPFRLPVSFSRGCPNRCIFCNEMPYWKRFRTRKAESLFLELKSQLKKVGGISYIDFHDSLINGKIAELEKLCDSIIAEGMEINWGGQAAISKHMTRDLLIKMKKAGCICLNYGLETGSYRTMQGIGKILAEEADIDRIIKDTHNAGIDCILNFMFGFPGETEEDFQATIDFLSRNRKYIDMVNPSPGFCAFEKGSYAHQHPDEFDIVLAETGALWESKDGTNNYAARLERFESFLKKAKEFGIRNFYPYDRLNDRDAVLGHYYYVKKEWDKAISYLDKATRQDPGDESSWIYLAKSLVSLGLQNRARSSFEEVVRIRLEKKEDKGAKDLIEEAGELGIEIAISRSGADWRADEG